MFAELEVGIDALLDRRDAQVLKPGDLHGQGRLVLEPGERGATPELERLGELRPPLARRKRLSLADQRLEAMEIDSAGVDAKHVAPRPRNEEVAAEVLTQSRHVVVQRRRCVRREPLAPELLDQTIGSDDFVRVEDQQRQQRAALGATYVDRLAVAENLERSEDP